MSGLSKSKKDLLDKLFTTKTSAKVRRRTKKDDGSFEFYTIVRDTSPIDFAQDSGEFAIKIHDEKPDAPLSPVYVNFRNLPDDLIKDIAIVLNEVALDKRPDYITGIPKTAVDMAKAYSKVSGIPFIDIFDKVELETGRKIVPKEGSKKGEGKKILILDDVVSHGNSKFEAIKVAEEMGYKVDGVLIFFDRGQGGSKKLEEMGYKVYAALKLQEALDYYLAQGEIDRPRYDNVMSYFSGS